MRALTVLIAFLVLGAAGCSGDKSVEGNVKIDSTEVFKKMKSTKSPPPIKPQN